MKKEWLVHPCLSTYMPALKEESTFLGMYLLYQILGHIIDIVKDYQLRTPI